MNIATKIASCAAGLILLTGACVQREDGWPNTGVINTVAEFNVSSYAVNGSENKQVFDGWRFQFASNQRLQAINGGQVFQAEWRKFGDSLVIYNFAQDPLTQLNKSWGANIINDVMIYTGRQDAAGSTMLNFDVIK